MFRSSPQFAKAACKCGKVEFEIHGKPLLCTNCCCNDCVTAASFIDKKACDHNVENISAGEEGNPQAVGEVLYPPSGIRLVKGAELIIPFKLRPNSASARTYTSCCYSAVITLVGAKAPNLSIAVSFNRYSISPVPQATCRINCREALRPQDLPKDGLRNNSTVSTGTVLKFVRKLIFGNGGPCRDPAAAALLYQNFDGESDGKSNKESRNYAADEGTTESSALEEDKRKEIEVAGAEAYAACGFLNVPMSNA